MTKRLREPIARSTDIRADKKLERVFVDLDGKMTVQISGKNGTNLLCGMPTHDSHECTF